MKKLLVLNLSSLAGSFAIALHLIFKMKSLEGRSVFASDFVDTVYLNIVFIAVFAFIFWATLIAALFLFFKNSIKK